MNIEAAEIIANSITNLAGVIAVLGVLFLIFSIGGKR